jgi:hypothetical protein
VTSFTFGNAFSIHVFTSPKLSTTTFSSASYDDDAQPKAEYGVSYIGGDPCGSKYNDDPFDLQGQTPGMPDDMKAGIQALGVDIKKVAEKEKAAETGPSPPLTSARKSQPTIYH